MKISIIIFSLLSILVISQSCKKDGSPVDFRDPGNAECLLSMIISEGDTNNIVYDENMKVTRYERGDDEYMEIEYDENGKVSRIDEYYPGNESYYTLYTWSTDEVEAIFYELVQEEWVSTSKRISELNDNNEVTKITDYLKNANNEWVEDGDYYLFEWSNGNMIKAENWDNYSSPGKTTGLKPLVKNNSNLAYTAKQAYQKKRLIKSKNDEFNLFSTTTIEYDDKINPFRYLTMGNLIAPDEFNSSKRNWAKKTYSDINTREIITTYVYVYNDKSLPERLDIEETRIYPNGTIINNYLKTYNYSCK